MRTSLSESYDNNTSHYLALSWLKNTLSNDPQTNKLLHEMDDIYKNYLALKTIKQETPNDTRTQWERLSDNMFDKINNMWKYFTKNLVDAIYDDKIKPEKNRTKSWNKEPIYFYEKKEKVLKYLKKQWFDSNTIDIIKKDYFIEKKIFDKITQQLNLKLDSKRTHQYKPLWIVFNIENTLTKNKIEKN